MDVFLSLSRQSEIYPSFSDIRVAGRFDIDTYETAWQFALATVRLPWLRQRFRQYVSRNQIDVVFCTMDHLWDVFLVGAIHQAGAHYLLTVHDAMRHPGEDQSWRRWMLRRDIEASDGALVLSRSVGEFLRSRYQYPSERTYLSAHGHFATESGGRPRELPRERPIRLLFFGRILPYKGLDLLLEAFPLLRAEFPRLTLEICGEGDLSPYRALLAGTRDLRVENRWIAEGEIAEIFDRSDLVVLPYREASQSGVVATAFAVGIPCVATPIPGLREQIADGVTGVIAASISAPDFAVAIASALRDPKFYRHMSVCCLQTAATTLSWDTIGESVAGALWDISRQGARTQTSLT